MRRALLPFVAIAAVAVMAAACATASLDAGKSIAVGWASLDAAALTADAAVKAGRLHGAPAATVSADLKAATAALQTASAAYAVAGNAPPTAQLIAASAAIAEITTILQGLPK